jgi:type IV secretion system protein VirD4
MESLTDFRFEWDVLWSRLKAQFSKEYLHTARFADLHEIHHLLSKVRALSLLLGIGPHARPIRVLPTKTKPELGNILDLGPSRCGKTQREEGQLLSWHASAVVNDIKRTMRRKTAGFRSLLGKTLTIDITGQGNRYDPLEGRMSERELYSSAHQLLYNPNDKETYFTERATKMLTQLFLAAREETRLTRLVNPAAKEVRPLPYVGQLAKLGLNQVAERLNRVSPPIANAFLEAEYSPFTDFEESKSRSDAWTTLSSRLYPILTDDIVRSFDGSDFSAKDLLFSEKPITVYFCWPEAELSSLTPLIRLVWESLVYDLIATYDLVDGVGCHDAHPSPYILPEPVG